MYVCAPWEDVTSIRNLIFEDETRKIYMVIFDSPSDSSNIGPTLLHSSHIAKMRNDTRPKS